VLLGSVADKVVRHAHCPVLVARPSPKTGAILAASDFSLAAGAAVIAADRKAARRSEATRLTVVHCLEFPPELMGFGFAPLVPARSTLPESRGARRESAKQQLVAEVRKSGLRASLLTSGGPARSLGPPPQLPACRMQSCLA
jgi:hypothetical protein